MLCHDCGASTTRASNPRLCCRLCVSAAAAGHVGAAGGQTRVTDGTAFGATPRVMLFTENARSIAIQLPTIRNCHGNVRQPRHHAAPCPPAVPPVPCTSAVWALRRVFMARWRAGYPRSCGPLQLWPSHPAGVTVAPRLHVVVPPGRVPSSRWRLLAVLAPSPLVLCTTFSRGEPLSTRCQPRSTTARCLSCWQRRSGEL